MLEVVCSTLDCVVGSVLDERFFLLGEDVHPAIINADKIKAIPIFFTAKPRYSSSKAPV